MDEHRYYVTLDGPGHVPDCVFRTPREGGPPTEKYDPSTRTWHEDVSLIDYFLGDATGHHEVSREVADAVAGVLSE